jgi:hypothetical protein
MASLLPRKESVTTSRRKMSELPDINWRELRSALSYLEGVENFHLARQGFKPFEYSFDVEQYRKFVAWLDKKVAQDE